MRFPKYAEAEHTRYNAEYDIDWRRGQRKFKQIERGIEVYENDLVELNSCGYRDPYWRQTVKRRFDLYIVLPKELGDYKFYTPEGEPVQKKYASGFNTFMHDFERGRVYPLSYRRTVQFLSEHAQPIGTAKVKVLVRDRRKEVDLINAVQEHVALGVTLNTVTDRPYFWKANQTNVKGFLKAGGGDMSVEGVRQTCKVIAAYPQFLHDAAVSAAGVFTEYDYLNVKEK